ncbi:hypothetical protein F8388_020300 [Cannabis sativa]|uniref:Pentatricopeptide repeat-containing protein n=1 Tax=Cannabis sativa TaxID=3483 RepID=A0A7J6FYI5_CANSA|nr:hypothetical protein F8388_020300 [Cannabis sativa]
MVEGASFPTQLVYPNYVNKKITTVQLNQSPSLAHFGSGDNAREDYSYLEFNLIWNLRRSLGKMEEARELFGRIPEPDTVSYNTMLVCYLHNSGVESAMEFFNKMPFRDSASWNTMISGYVEFGDLDSAIEFFELAPVKSVVAWTAMVTGYMKFGKIELAEKMFHHMPVKNVVSWNTMISGMLKNGRAEESFEAFFGAMIQSGIKVEFIDFEQWDYGVELKPEHYTCMVDLLGRAGRLIEAVDLIKKMPFKPHLAIFGTLLGACRIHKNLELAEYAAKNLLSLDPSSAAGYVPTR